MTSNPLPGTRLCTNVDELRDRIINVPDSHRESLLQRSNNVMMASKRKDCLSIYFISDNPDDMILLGILYHTLRNESFSSTDGNYTSRRRYPSPTTALVMICGWREGTTMNRVINTLTQHHRHHIHETAPHSRIWSIDCNKSKSARLIVTLGDPATPLGAEQDEKTYWTHVQQSSLRCADLIARTSTSTQNKNYKVFNTTSPVLLFTMPDWFWTCVRILITSNTIRLGNTTGTFELAPDLQVAKPHFECVVRQAMNRFPILHTGFEYSGGDTVASMRDLSGWEAIWPKVIPPDVYSRLLKRGLDQLYMSLIRLAAAAHGAHGQVCVDKAREYLRDYGGGKPWIEEAVKVENYTAETCDLQRALASLRAIAQAADCPIHIVPTALAALIPSVVASKEDDEVIAARVTLQAEDDGDGKVQLGLSGDSPQYILVSLNDDVGESIDMAFEDMWLGCVNSIKERSTSLPRLAGEMAEGWRRFCMGTRGLMNMLAKEEKDRGAMTDVELVKKRFADGNMTAICRRTLDGIKAGKH